MNATEAYQANRNEIDAKIGRIQALLKELDAQQAADPRNWGFAGVTGHIKGELDEILGTLEETE